jgi:hypothetical protein
MSKPSTKFPKNAPSASRCSKSGHKTGIPDAENRCTHTDALGRRCRALAVSIPGFREVGSKFGLCPTHATSDRQVRQADAVANYLFKTTPHLDTASAVNHFLEKLVEMVVNNRIPVRNATLLAYLGSLLLKTVDRVKDEVLTIRGHEGWNEKLFVALNTIDPQSFIEMIESIAKKSEESGEPSGEDPGSENSEDSADESEENSESESESNAESIQ